jgi:hypothetical protein
LLDIAEIPTIRAGVTNHDAISLMLDQVLVAPPRKYRPQLPLPVTRKGQPIGDLADELLEKLEALGEHGREDEVVQLKDKGISPAQCSGYSAISS